MASVPAIRLSDGRSMALTKAPLLIGLGLLFAVTGCGAAKPPRATPPIHAMAAASKGSADPRFDATLSGSTYPFPVRVFELESQGERLRMAYLDEKPASPNGRVVLLLHGKNFGASYWAPTIRLLTEKGYRVIAPDQIGFGKSDKPHDYQFTFQALAENTKALLDSLGIAKVAVVGHSMGGMLATRFTLMLPERVSELVLVNPIGLEDWKTVVPYRSVDEWYARELRATPDSIREYQKKSYYDGEWKPEYEALIEPAAGQTKHPDYPKVAWCSARTYDMIFTQPVVYELPLLKAPTLLVIGQRDRTALGRDAVAPEVAAKLGDYPALGKNAAAAIPGAKLVEIPKVGHMPQIEAWDTYAAALVSFLERSRP